MTPHLCMAMQTLIILIKGPKDIFLSLYESDKSHLDQPHTSTQFMVCLIIIFIITRSRVTFNDAQHTNPHVGNHDDLRSEDNTISLMGNITDDII